jgi:hypothetical protein
VGTVREFNELSSVSRYFSQQHNTDLMCKPQAPGLKRSCCGQVVEVQKCVDICRCHGGQICKEYKEGRRAGIDDHNIGLPHVSEFLPLWVFG